MRMNDRNRRVWAKQRDNENKISPDFESTNWLSMNNWFCLISIEVNGVIEDAMMMMMMMMVLMMTLNG